VIPFLFALMHSDHAQRLTPMKGLFCMSHRARSMRGKAFVPGTTPSNTAAWRDTRGSVMAPEDG
jgi:hypothetical protein